MQTTSVLWGDSAAAQLAGQMAPQCETDIGVNDSGELASTCASRCGTD